MGARLTLERAGVGPEVDKCEAYKAAYMLCVAFYLFERIQFMSSFAATFAVVDKGWFQSIGTAVQKIMQDEYYIHAEFGLQMLKHENLHGWGKKAAQELRPYIIQVYKEVLASEKSFAPFLLGEGRSLPGFNIGSMHTYADYVSQVPAQELGILDSVDQTWVSRNPFPFMEEWLKVDGFQRARQEMDDNAYLIGIMRDDTIDGPMDLDAEGQGPAWLYEPMKHFQNYA